MREPPRDEQQDQGNRRTADQRIVPHYFDIW